MIRYVADGASSCGRLAQRVICHLWLQRLCARLSALITVISRKKGKHVPPSKLKLLEVDPAEVQTQSEAIKARYSKLFWV